MLMRRRSTNKYLSNKELLKEIHKSKARYSEYLDPKYIDYDLVIENPQKITKKMIKEAQQTRANRLNDIEADKLFDDGMSNKQILDWMAKNSISYKDIPVEDLVFRQMTDEHIPTFPDKKSGKPVKAKCNFKPFQHWSFLNNAITCVGKSHYKNGKFEIIHNKMTDKLAKSLLMLVDRYGQRGNWRGYTWLEEMKGQAIIRLTQVALQFDENKSENPFAFYTTIITRSFTYVVNTEKEEQRLYQEMIQEKGYRETFNQQASRDRDNYIRDNPI